MIAIAVGIYSIALMLALPVALLVVAWQVIKALRAH